MLRSRWVFRAVLLCSIGLLTLLVIRRVTAILNVQHTASISIEHTIRQQSIGEAEIGEPPTYSMQETVSNQNVVKGTLKHQGSSVASNIDKPSSSLKEKTVSNDHTVKETLKQQWSTAAADIDNPSINLEEKTLSDDHIVEGTLKQQWSTLTANIDTRSNNLQEKTVSDDHVVKGTLKQHWSTVAANIDKPANNSREKTVSEDHIVEKTLKPNLPPSIPSKEISDVLSEMRQNIHAEMDNYQYPNGKYNVPASSLADLVPELGGQPIRNLVITTWRSGSTFLGDVLNSHPGNFYHYEPFFDHHVTRIREGPSASEAITRLKALLSCNYTGLDKYLGYAKSHDQKYILNKGFEKRTGYDLLFFRNTRLWRQCLEHPSLCWSPQFLNPACRLFPFQSVKTVRLRLRLAERLLADQSLSVRALLLVRDPRATLQSRRQHYWCRAGPECREAETLCRDLTDDYASAKDLAVKYPNRFRVVRYEELSVTPYKTVRELFQFFGLDFHPSVQKFLETHTKANAGGAYSTHRDSNSAAVNWRHNLPYEEVRAIQGQCKEAMDAWGYLQALNSTHQREFIPFGDYRLP